MPRSRSAAIALLIAFGCGTPPTPVAPAPAVVPAPTPTPPASAPAPAATVASARAESAYVASLRAKLGADAELSLVPRVQATAEAALLATGLAGAVIALDPHDGSVLALYSVAGDRGDPLTLLDVPASTWKPFTALAALSSGVLAPDTVLPCTGHFDHGGARLSCAQVHGPQTVAHAVATSCNAFFYAVGAKLAPARLGEVARAFGFASPSGIELDETAGVLPELSPKDLKQRPNAPLLNASGHGDYRVSLLGLARAYAVFANGGGLVPLHLVHGRRAPDGTLTPTPRRTPGKVLLDRAAFDVVRASLLDVVAADYGTGHAFARAGVPFAGKSGTADAPPPANTATPPSTSSTSSTPGEDSLFIGYLPPEAPTVLVAVRLERAPPEQRAGAVVARILAETGAVPP